VAADVGEFVQQESLHLLGGQAGEQSDRDQDGGAEVPYDHGHLGQAGFEQDDGARDA